MSVTIIHYSSSRYLDNLIYSVSYNAISALISLDSVPI